VKSSAGVMLYTSCSTSWKSSAGVMLYIMLDIVTAVNILHTERTLIISRIIQVDWTGLDY